jgi:hypothetical protein
MTDRSIIIHLQSSQILPSLIELILLHLFPDVGVDVGPLGVKPVELEVVEPQQIVELHCAG